MREILSEEAHHFLTNPAHHSHEFQNADPFPHIVIDNFFNEDFLSRIVEKYPNYDDVKWWKYDNPFEKKLAFNKIFELDPCFERFFNFINSREFATFLEKLTGIENLLSDPSLHGGGLHRIEKHGKLDIHADFNYHKVTGWFSTS